MKKFYFLFLITLFSTISLYSDTATWTGGAGDQAWTSAANWGAVAAAPGQNGAGQTATFTGTNEGLVSLPGVPLNNTLKALDISGGSYSFKNASLAFTNADISTSKTTTFNSDVITGGSLTVTGPGTVNLNGNNTLTTITQNNGTITLGEGGNTTVTTYTQNGGILTSGTTSTITGDLTATTGTVSPGDDGTIGTLNITGNFTLGAAGIYSLDITPAETDFISVGGTFTSTAGSILNITESAGAFAEGTTYTILSAAGGIGGTLPTIVESSPEDFSLSTSGGGNDLVLTIVQNIINVRPLAIAIADTGNANDIALANFVNGFDASNQAAFDIAAILLADPATAPFLEKARKIAPLQNGLNNWVLFQNVLGIVQSVQGRLRALGRVGKSAPLTNNLGSSEKELKHDLLSQYIAGGHKTLESHSNHKRKRTEEYISPIFLYSHGDEVVGAPGFDNYAEGITFGFQRSIFQKNLENSNWEFLLGGGLSYVHSRAFFYTDRGTSNQNGVYATSTLSFINHESAAELTVYAQYNGSGNKVTRVINLQPGFGVRQEASSLNWSNGLLFGCDGLINPQFTVWESQEQTRKNTFNIAPQAGVYTYFLWSGAFEEKGAGNFNLRGQSQQATWIVPTARLNFIRQFETQKVSLLPTVYVGWIGYYPLRANNITSGLYNLDNNTNIFTINTNPVDHQYTNQFMTGFNFAIIKSESFVIEIASNVALFDKLTNVYSSVRWQFSF